MPTIETRTNDYGATEYKTSLGWLTRTKIGRHITRLSLSTTTADVKLRDEFLKIWRDTVMPLPSLAEIQQRRRRWEQSQRELEQQLQRY